MTHRHLETANVTSYKLYHQLSARPRGSCVLTALELYRKCIYTGCTKINYKHIHDIVYYVLHESYVANMVYAAYCMSRDELAAACLHQLSPLRYALVTG